MVPLVNRGEALLRGKRDDALPISIEHGVALHKHRVGGPHRGKRPVVVVSLDLDNDQRDTERRRGLLRFLYEGLRGLAVDEESDPGGSWLRFLKQLQPLGFVPTLGPVCYPGDVPSGRGQALHETEGDGIRGAEPRDDRDRLGRILGCSEPRQRDGDDDVYAGLDQFSGQRREPVELALATSLLDNEVLALHVAQLAEGS
jgi:hypothetical protein